MSRFWIMGLRLTWRQVGGAAIRSESQHARVESALKQRVLLSEWPDGRGDESCLRTNARSRLLRHFRDRIAPVGELFSDQCADLKKVEGSRREAGDGQV